jgi:hypothetical protein
MLTKISGMLSTGTTRSVRGFSVSENTGRNIKEEKNSVTGRTA